MERRRLAVFMVLVLPVGFAAMTGRDLVVSGHGLIGVVGGGALSLAIFMLGILALRYFVLRRD